MLTLNVVCLSWHVIRNLNNLNPEGSCKQRESGEAVEKVQHSESTRALADQENCAVPTSCQTDLSPVGQCLAHRAPGTHNSAGCQTRAVCGTRQSDHCGEGGQSTMAAFCSFPFTFCLLPNTPTQDKTGTHSQLLGAFY